MCISALLLLSGCFSVRYQQPSMEDPHAVIKYRRVYEQTDSEFLNERMLINGKKALSLTNVTKTATISYSNSVLAHPGTNEVVVHSEFLHSELRYVPVRFLVRIPYTSTESYTCGKSTCRRTVTKYRHEYRTRWVRRYVEVLDGLCKRRFETQFDSGKIYLVQMTYVANNICSLQCYEQVFDETGEFELIRCVSLAE